MAGAGRESPDHPNCKFYHYEKYGFYDGFAPRLYRPRADANPAVLQPLRINRDCTTAAAAQSLRE